MKKTCLIIGGGGFIGTSIVENLLNKNYYVRVIDKNNHNLQLLKRTYHEHLEIISEDINNISIFPIIVEQMDNIIWLLHSSVPAESMDDYLGDLSNNIFPFVKFLNYIKKLPNLFKFLYFSSGGTIYGNPYENKPLKETSIKNPISQYGLTKLIAERYIDIILAEANFSKYIIRPSNVYGPGQNLSKPQGIIGHALKSAYYDHPFYLFGEGNNIRDFIYITDLVNLITKVIDNDNSKINSMNIFNLGSGLGIKISELLKLIMQVSNKKLNVVYKPERVFDIKYNVLDVGKVKNNYNWEPAVNLNTGVDNVWKWINNET